MQSIIDNNEKYLRMVGLAGLLIFSIMFPAIPGRFTALFLCLFGLIAVVSKKELYNDWTLRIVFVVAFAIGMIDWHAGVPDNLKYILIWPLSFVFGKWLVGNKKDDSEKNLVVASAVMTIGLFIQGVINYCNHNDGIEISESWNGWNEIWTGNFMSRTVYTYDFLLVASTLFLAVLLFNKKRMLAIGIVIINIATIVMDLIMARGRLQVVMQVAVTFIMLAIYLFNNRKKTSEKSKKLFLIAVIAFVAAIVLFSVLVALNVGGIGDAYHNSFLSRDGGILRNSRFRSMAEGLVLTFQQPLGGWETPSLGIAHNVFLLFAKEYDIIIFFILIAFEVLSLINAFKLILKKNCTYGDYLAFSMLITLLLYYNIETCPWRYRSYWVILIITSGFISQKLKVSTKED